MSSLLILGSGGHARVLAETALASGVFSSICFLDDSVHVSNGNITTLGWPVLGPLSMCTDSSIIRNYPHALVGIGSSALRLHWLTELDKVGYNIPSVVHPSAVVSPSAFLGPGSVVFANSVIQSGSNLCAGVILNTGCSIDHDVHLSDGVHICPGARLAGEVHVGSRSWIGIGASVIQQVRIGSDVIVGAGAAVVQDLADGVTAVGIPARSR